MTGVMGKPSIDQDSALVKAEHNVATLFNNKMQVIVDLLTNLDSNVGWRNFGPTSVLSSRRWANVSQTFIAIWEATVCRLTSTDQ